jgi:opacity protein-like surface antigen
MKIKGIYNWLIINRLRKPLLERISYVIALWMPITTEASCLSGFEVETKVSSFFPSSKIIRGIYSDAIPYYELEVAKPFCNDWQVWVSLGYLSNKGYAMGCNNKTSFRLIPITLGLKYLCSISDSMDLYAGAGACWSFFKNKDHSSFVYKNISNNALGGLFKLGFIYHVKKNIFIDIFTEYLCQHFSFKHHYEHHYTLRHNLNMSGFKIGGGLGFNF